MLNIQETMEQIAKELNRYGTIVEDKNLGRIRKTKYYYQGGTYTVTKICGETKSIEK